MDASHIECRVNRHSWRPEDAWREGSVFVQTQRCPRCDAARSQVIDARTGMVRRTTYAYPAGYLNTGGGRATRESIGKMRLALVRSLARRSL